MHAQSCQLPLLRTFERESRRLAVRFVRSLQHSEVVHNREFTVTGDLVEWTV
jgi:hypothetical protein